MLLTAKRTYHTDTRLKYIDISTHTQICCCSQNNKQAPHILLMCRFMIYMPPGVAQLKDAQMREGKVGQIVSLRFWRVSAKKKKVVYTVVYT